MHRSEYIDILPGTSNEFCVKGPAPGPARPGPGACPVPAARL